MDQRARQRDNNSGNYLFRHVLFSASARPSCIGRDRVRILQHACFSHLILSWTNAIFLVKACCGMFKTKTLDSVPQKGYEAINVEDQQSTNSIESTRINLKIKASVRSKLVKVFRRSR